MKRTQILATLVALVLPVMTAGAQGFNATNPSAHDPVMAKEGDTWYVFTTGMGISCMTSQDLKTWTPAYSIFDKAPTWVTDLMPDFRNHMWAPDVFFYKGEWHVFYSCSRFGRNTSVIGHVSSPSLDPKNPAYKWTDHGMVVQSVPNRDMWNAIDPNFVLDEDGNPWMDFGSFWNGIMMVRLDENLKVAEPQEWLNICRRERSFDLDPANAGDGAVEAPFIYKKGDWYYLFASFDYCCRGANSTYKVAIGRSKSAKGPFLDKEGKDMAKGGGTTLIEGNKTDYVAIGHCAAYTIEGKDLFVSHIYMAGRGDSRLFVREMSWEDGWPVVKF